MSTRNISKVHGRKRTLTRLIFLFGILGSPVAFSTPLLNLIDSMVENSWAKANNNSFFEVWTPAALRPDDGSPQTVISAWSGAAWDSNRGDFIVWGGDNEPYGGNEVYRWRSTTLEWERASLPSANVNTGVLSPGGQEIWTTIDGVDNTPISGETFDNAVFLPIVDRFAVLGGSAYPGAGLNYYRDDVVTRTGPYFWDPSKANADLVGGTTGSGVDPATAGGQMWENRQSIQTIGGDLVGPKDQIAGVSDYAEIDGKDVVFTAGNPNLASSRGLYKYTVNSLEDPSADTWEKVGAGNGQFSGGGAGAYDPSRNIFLRNAGKYLTYWDLDNSGENNENIMINAVQEDGVTPFLTSSYYGMAYDPINGEFLLWDGGDELWALLAPDILGSDGWIARNIMTLGDVPPSPASEGFSFTGVYGKWLYLPELEAFLGVVDPIYGDVWIYKPFGVSAVPTPSAWLLFGSAILVLYRNGSRTKKSVC